MKKTFSFFMTLAICAMVFVSCKPEPTPEEPTPEEPTVTTPLDGQFMPERKIAHVEEFSVITVDSVEQLNSSGSSDYVWNGDLLTTINVKDGEGHLFERYSYQYDSLNRIMKMLDEVADGTDTYEFIYEDKDLVQVKRFDGNNELMDDYTFTKTDGKVTSISHIQYWGELTNSTQDIVWENGNITEIGLTENGITSPTAFTFDDKTNPFFGLYTPDFYYQLDKLCQNSNELSSETSMVSGPVSMLITTADEYEYDGNYPTKRTSVRSVGFMETKTVITYTYVN